VSPRSSSADAASESREPVPDSEPPSAPSTASGPAVLTGDPDFESASPRFFVLSSGGLSGGEGDDVLVSDPSLLRFDLELPVFDRLSFVL
jgi:hypothetical protein